MTVRRAVTVTVMLGLFLSSLHSGQTSWAQEADRLKQALAYQPTQKGVDYDKPTETEVENLRLENASTIGQTGFVVRDASNRILRRFVDTQGNRKIDTWAYYQNGYEIYRDIDTDADGKPDRFQWLGPAGTRTGVDSNQDLIIDRWERISAQEVTQVVVEAMVAGAPKRLESLLLTPEELAGLNLDPAVSGVVAERLAETRQKILSGTVPADWSEDLKWLHFSAAVPGAILSTPSGSSTPDEPKQAERLHEVFDYVSAIVEVQNQSQQLLVGSLIRVDNAWRLIDFPVLAGDQSGAIVGGVFFQMETGLGQAMASTNLSTEGVSPELLKAYQTAEEALREAIGNRTGPALAVLHQRRAQALWKIVVATRGSDRDAWLRQYVDVVTSAYQMDEYPAGLSLIEKQIAEMKQENFDKELIAYAEFRHLGAWYSRATESGDNIDQVQDQWQKKLGEFVKQYPRSILAAEAMFLLANIDDYLGDTDAAAAVYRRIVSEFPNVPLASRAKGAVIRLTSVGKPIPFRGTTVQGQAFSLDQLKGKTVLIHYWATWCEPCKAEFAELQMLNTKYAKDGFQIVSVSLDASKADVTKYLQENRLPWIHLYEEGGLDGSPLAAQLGVIALPTLILIGADGTLMDRGIALPQVERELRKLSR